MTHFPVVLENRSKSATCLMPTPAFFLQVSEGDQVKALKHYTQRYPPFLQPQPHSTTQLLDQGGAIRVRKNVCKPMLTADQQVVENNTAAIARSQKLFE
jgi:hypothetical protein